MRSKRGAPKGSVLGAESGLARESLAACARTSEELLGAAVAGDVALDVAREQLRPAASERRQKRSGGS
jgi:hypothetical protein